MNFISWVELSGCIAFIFGNAVAELLNLKTMPWLSNFASAYLVPPARGAVLQSASYFTLALTAILLGLQYHSAAPWKYVPFQICMYAVVFGLVLVVLTAWGRYIARRDGDISDANALSWLHDKSAGAAFLGAFGMQGFYFSGTYLEIIPVAALVTTAAFVRFWWSKQVLEEKVTMAWAVIGMIGMILLPVLTHGH